jgi:hypothetical protein
MSNFVLLGACFLLGIVLRWQPQSALGALMVMMLPKRFERTNP